MPSKTQLFSTILSEVTKGFQGGRKEDNSGSQGQQGSGSNYGRNQPQMNSGAPGGYPGQFGADYPNQPGGGQQGGYSGYPGEGYPGGPAPGGYPGGPALGGYTGGPAPGGYSGGPAPGGYPGGPAPGGYPGGPASGGYPGGPASGGYPGGPAPGGYPSGPAPGGYPGGPVPGGYPGGPAPGGYPGGPASGGYPGGAYPGMGYPAQSGGSYPGQAAMPSGTPTIRPYPAFNPNGDAETLRKAMKGLGCDKNKVVQVLCARANFQRQQIANAYKTMYGKDLINDLKSELSGDFEGLILALMEPPARYDAQQLHKAMVGLGTTESVLIEIMCSRTNAQIAELRAVYQQMFGKQLEKDLIGETSGDFKRLLVSLCAGGRDESGHTDPLRANQDAKKLYKAGEQRLGTDESCFNAILASQNYAQLRLVFQEYQKITNHSIQQAIDAEFGGDIRDGLKAMVACAQNKAAYFATLLYNSMAGMGTRDNDLIRVIVTQSEVNLHDVRQEFQALYKKSLENFIKGDCSGAYKDGLITLVRGN